MWQGFALISGEFSKILSTNVSPLFTLRQNAIPTDKKNFNCPEALVHQDLPVQTESKLERTNGIGIIIAKINTYVGKLNGQFGSVPSTVRQQAAASRRIVDVQAYIIGVT